MADRQEGQVFLMKRYLDKAKLVDGLKHASKRELVMETQVVVEEGCETIDIYVPRDIFCFPYFGNILM